MHRFFIDSTLAEMMVIRGADVRHISRVLRLNPGDVVTIVATDGQTGLAEIGKISAGQVDLVLRRRIEEQKEPPITVVLAQSLPKRDKLEFIIQKAVELGAKGIAPLLTDHCVPQYREEKLAERRTRWQKIAGEAAKQCGRNFIPPVYPARRLADFFSQVAADHELIVLYEGPAPETLKQVLRTGSGEKYVLIVGPEGGFSPAEIRLAKEYGSHIVTMGSRILRTETASLAAMAAIMYELGDLGG